MTKDQTNDTAEVLCLTREVDHLNDCTTLYIDGEELITFHDPAPEESVVHFRQASLWLEAQGMTYLQPIELSRDQMDALRTAAAKTERDALEALDTLTEERDALKAKLHESQANFLSCFEGQQILARQRDAAIAEWRALQAERDAMRETILQLDAQRDVAVAGRDALAVSLKEVAAERDALRDKLVTIAAKHPEEALDVMEAQRNADAVNQEAAETMELILAAKAKIQEAREAAAAAMPDLSACLSSLDTLDSALREIGGE